MTWLVCVGRINFVVQLIAALCMIASGIIVLVHMVCLALWTFLSSASVDCARCLHTEYGKIDGVDGLASGIVSVAASFRYCLYRTFVPLCSVALLFWATQIAFLRAIILLHPEIENLLWRYRFQFIRLCHCFLAIHYAMSDRVMALM